MIPKIIHYCWFGRNPLPPLAIKCIESWKKYLPEYEIREWNEDNFDVNIIPYTQEAYKAKKYAFVSDYARFWILYKYGGLYFDTDVEIIKPIEDIISNGPFMGSERLVKMSSNLYREDDSAIAVNPGLGLAAVPGLEFYKRMLDNYAVLKFILSDGTLNTKTVVQYTTELLMDYGLKETDIIQNCMDIWIYPSEYFCPKSYENGKLYLTDNTRTIHHFAASWLSPKQRFILFIKSIIGVNLSRRISIFLKKFY